MEAASNLSYALAYAAIGWAVLPLHWPVAKDKCSCGRFDCDRPAKHPYGKLVPHGVKDASSDVGTITEWWTQCPHANIGVATGARSGIVVIDVDPRHGGTDSWKKISSNGHAVATTRSITGGGGFHEIFAYPPSIGPVIRNKGGVGGLEGLDVRSDGGLIVVPPSRHASGRKYAWSVTPHTLRPTHLPEWLRTLLVGTPGKTEETTGNYDWDTVFDGIADGNRDNTLFRYACYLRNLNVGRRQVEYLVLEAAKRCPNPFPRAEALKKVEQAWQYRPDPGGRVLVDSNGDPIRHIRVSDFTSWAKRNTRDDAWLIEGWVPRRSTGLIVGKSGSYKSWITLHALACIASGRPFLGQFPVHNPGKVVLFQQEDAAMTTIKRMASILGVGYVKDLGPDEWEVPVPDDLGGNLLVEEEHLLSFENEHAMSEFEEYIGDTKPLAVVLDPLNSLASAKDFMAGAPERMRLLKRLRDRFGTTFAIVHHTAKGAAGNGWESIWGSQFLVGWKEFGWHLQKVAGESSVVMARYSKDSVEPERLRIDLSIKEDGISFRTTRVTADQLILLEGDSPERPRGGRVAQKDRRPAIKEFRLEGCTSNIVIDVWGVDLEDDILIDEDE